MFERALAIDPGSVEAQSRLADVLSARVMAGWADPAGADIARAEALAGQALAASPGSALAHNAKGQVLRAQHRFAEAIPEYEAVLALNRNSPFTLYCVGQCKLYTGSIEEAIRLVEQAIRLSPHDPQLGLWYWQIGFAHLLQSRIDEAISVLERSRTLMPEHPAPHLYLASAYGLKGEIEQAAAELAEARRLGGEGRLSNLAKMKSEGYVGVVPSVRALLDATYFAGLRKAGIPEE
jgi:tetratricopeptide (TPR) repeat protein